MEEWVARDAVDGGEGDAGGGEEEWVEWIMERRSGSSGQEEWVKWTRGVGKRVGPLVSEFCFDILRRVGIEYKTNNL